MIWRRRVSLALLTHLPFAAMAWANVVYVWNHFYWRGPYLHDSGWFSATVYRAGIMPRNPPSVAHTVEYYWGWHPSILVSLGSVLSYVFPGDRVAWYGVFQALVYAPLAFAVPLLASRSGRSTLAGAGLVTASSFAFCFGGQVIAALGYPHFEIFASAGIAIMLAALATGRESIAWLGLAMAIATREDGGLHAASFLFAALVSDVTGRPFPIARRRLLALMATGVGMAALAVGIQKKFFVSADSWGIYLAGTPPYAHLTRDLLAYRFSALAERAGFVWAPFLGTLIVAAVRRDWRYLLGWGVTVPWFVLNVTARQDVKGELSIYTGFPFVGSAFWLAVYARVGDRRMASLGWRLPVVLAGVLPFLGLCGLWRGFPAALPAVARDMLWPRPANYAGIRAFASELRQRSFGEVRTDPAIASWVVETVRHPDLITHAEMKNGVHRGDAFAFWLGPTDFTTVAASSFTHCGRVPDSSVFFCSRPGGVLPATVIPSSPMLTRLQLDGTHARREGDAIAVDAGRGLRVWGPLDRIRPGSYVAEWTLSPRGCNPEVADVGAPGIRLDVVMRWGERFVEGVNATPDARAVAIPFVVTPDMRDELWEFRAFAGACSYRIDDLWLRSLPATTQP